MKQKTSSKILVVGWVAIALAVVISTAIAMNAWKSVKTRPKERSIEVTGSAKKRIISDLIEWGGRIETRNMDSTEAYRELKANLDKTLAWFDHKGISKDKIRVSAVSTNEAFETVYEGVGEERIQRRRFMGYEMIQSISIRSSDVEKVERI